MAGAKLDTATGLWESDRAGGIPGFTTVNSI